jgi:hypothetical protein
MSPRKGVIYRSSLQVLKSFQDEGILWISATDKINAGLFFYNGQCFSKQVDLPL